MKRKRQPNSPGVNALIACLHIAEAYVDLADQVLSQVGPKRLPGIAKNRALAAEIIERLSPHQPAKEGK